MEGAGLHTGDDGRTVETVPTGNLAMALFNHDTSRDQNHSWLHAYGGGLMSRSITAKWKTLEQ